MHKLVFLDQIDEASSPKVRAEIREDVVDEYMQYYKDKVAMPDVHLFTTGRGEKFLIADGRHRIRARIKGEFKTVEATLHEGGRADALKFALTCNLTHGLRRTNEDKRACVLSAIKEWPKLTAASLAEVCAVDHKTVAAVRSGAEASGEVAVEPVRQSADGRSVPAHLPKKKPPKSEGKPQHLDSTGFKIPDEALEMWNRAKEIQSILTAITKLKSILKKAHDEKDPLFREIEWSAAFADIANLYSNVSCAKPYAVCSSCQGRDLNKGCTMCGGKRFISAMRYKTTVPEEHKKVRERQCKK